MHHPILSQLTKKERRQLCSLAKRFLPELETAFPAEPFRATIEPTPYGGNVEDRLVVRLASANPQVQELRCVLYQDDEITVYWGSRSHAHISGDSLWRKNGTPQKKAEQATVEKALRSIQEIVSGRFG